MCLSNSKLTIFHVLNKSNCPEGNNKQYTKERINKSQESKTEINLPFVLHLGFLIEGMH